ncbi:MAG: response regulator transcription factor [Acidobacteria bacterium]|nr:response regulator transcription factor [Acidobacteriota bacterium]
MANEIRVAIADDHPLLRKGLRQVLEADSNMRVVAEAGDGQELILQMAISQPQIAIVDVDMPKQDGFAVAKEICKRKWPVDVVFLTIHNEEDTFYAAMDLGVKGYVLKDSALIEITEAIRTVAAGQFYVSRPLTTYLLQRRHRSQALLEREPGLKSLTASERRILQMIADNKSSKEIGEELQIHYRTVENHRVNICQKLGLSGTNSLLRFALQHKSEL